MRAVRCGRFVGAARDEARRHQSYRSTQNQQHRRSGIARAPNGQTPAARGDRRGAARRRNRDRRREARPAGRRLYGRTRHRAASAQRRCDAIARCARARRHQRNADAQRRDQRSLSRLGGAGRGYVLRDRQRGRRAPLSVYGAGVSENYRDRGEAANLGALRTSAQRRRRLRRRGQQRNGHLCRFRGRTARSSFGA